MSAAFKKAAKSRQRQHRERAQPASRKKLGLLEKKKDYKLRAEDYHKKQNALRALQKKALDKNPDEFYFKMINTRLKDGVHVIKQPKDEVTPEQAKLMKTQDIKYVEMKRVAEAKKIERLKSELHLLDAEGKQPNKHVFFFDTGDCSRIFSWTNAENLFSCIPAHLCPATRQDGVPRSSNTSKLLGPVPRPGAAAAGWCSRRGDVGISSWQDRLPRLPPGSAVPRRGSAEVTGPRAPRRRGWRSSSPSRSSFTAGSGKSRM